MTLKEIALELLDMYRRAETTAIWEYSGTISEDMAALESECNRIRVEIENASAMLITRSDALETISDYYHHKTDNQKDALKEALDRVPPAFDDLISRREAINTITAQDDVVSDLISRQEVKKILRIEWVKLFPMELDPYISLAMAKIENIPSAEPWDVVKTMLKELEQKEERLCSDYCDATARLRAIRKIAESGQTSKQKIDGIKPLAKGGE